MQNQAFPSVNEHESSWADIGVTLNVPGGETSPWVDLEGIKYSTKLDVGESRGTSGGRPLRRTAGSAAYDASATLSRKGVRQLQDVISVAAKAVNAVRNGVVILSAVSFDVLIQHTPLGTEDVFEVKLSGCRYFGSSDDSKQGSDADTVELTLNPIEILEKNSAGEWMALR